MTLYSNDLCSPSSLVVGLCLLLGLSSGCDLLTPEAPDPDVNSWPVASSIMEAPNGDVYVNAYVRDAEIAVGRSEDQGASWGAVSIPFSPPAPEQWAVAADGTVFAMNPFVDIAESRDSTHLAIRVARSDDGRSWTTHNRGLPDARGRLSAHGNLMTVHEGRVYLTTGEGVYRSGIQETEWEQLSTRFVYSFQSVEAGNHPGLYAAVVNDSGVPMLQKSTQAGESWTTVVDSFGVYEMAYAPKTQTLYASTDTQTVYEVHVDEKRVEKLSKVDPAISPGETGRRNELFDLEAGPEGMLYAGLGAGAYRSTDGGETWSECANEKLTATSEDPRDAQLGIPDVRDLLVTSDGIVIAATWNGVYRSTTDCQSWNRVIGPGGAEDL